MSSVGYDPEDMPEEVIRLQALVESLFVGSRTVQSYGAEHPLSRQAVVGLCERVAELSPPFSLQFVGQAFFKDRVMVPLSTRVYLLGQHVAQVLRRLGIQELVVERRLSLSEAGRLCEALGDAEAGRRSSLEGVELAGLSWREIPAARYGVEMEVVDPEVLAAAQLALAVGVAELLPGERAAWDYARGMTVVRRLERAVEVSREAVGRALEVSPGAWTAARRSVAACAHTLIVLGALGVGGATRRVVAHAALAVAWTGYRERGGAPFEKAAEAARDRLLEAPSTTRAGVEPHRARVSALVFVAAGGEIAVELPAPLPGLLRLVYALELRRCPQDVPFDLTLADLLALALSRPVAGCSPVWPRVLAAAYGEFPSGARVLLPDGRAGIVLGASDAGALRPQVLVGGSICVPDGPVRFVSPRSLAEMGGK